MSAPDTALSQPKSLHRDATRRASRRRAEIPDSDEAAPLSSPASSRIQVVIPTDKVMPHQQKSRSSLSTSVGSPDDQQSDYETPASSIAVTPMEGKPKHETTSPGIHKALVLPKRRLQRIAPARQRASITPMLQQALEDLDPSTEEDAKLARKLQAEEYGDQVSQPKNRLDSKRKRIAISISDSENDFNELALPDTSDEDIPLAKRRRASKPRSQVTQQPTRRRRARRSSDISLVSLPNSPTAVESEEEALSGPGGEAFVDSDSELSSAPGSDAQVESDQDSDQDSDQAPGSHFARINAQYEASRRAARAARGGARSRRAQRSSTDAQSSRARRERQRLERAHPEVKTMWDTLKAVQPIQPVAAEQPAGISRKLKPFQLEGLDWMIKQEKSQWKGGLLGDEMGMGKTIQAVSLIMSDFPAKEPTLVLVPPVALMQWQAEINAYTGGKLKVLVYHNTNPKVKSMKVKDLKAFNVIMVSYSGLESMYRKETMGWSRNDGIVKEDSILHAITYHRLILDEAHSIKTRTTSVARACFALQAKYKWCLSGTPVQNRIGEFFSLLRFLEVQPFACYFCKVCSCRELHWSQNEERMCTHCNHSGFSHVSIFNQEILNPITQNDDPELRKEALGKLRLITGRIMLRRIKRDQTAAMELPPKDVVIHDEFFGEMERDFSQSIMGSTQRKFDTYVSRGVMLNNYANIFGLIMQMRQVANHPDLILKKHAEEGQNVLLCSVCDEPAEEAIRSRCRHDFCRQCAKNYVRSFEGMSGDADCPRCHIPLAIDFDQPDIEQEEEHVKKSSIINRIKMDDWTSSTKIEALIYDLYRLRSESTTSKSIVFSQFTSMLQLVEWRLRRAGFSTVMLDGSMSPTQRQRSIEYFMSNVGVEVFLVSLKAGGVALNLTEASKVYIVDPYVSSLCLI